MNEKQSRFVAEYLIDLNATEAAKRAGYSDKTAYSVGWEILKKPEIQVAIKVAQDARSKRTEITVDRVLQELAKIAFFDPRKLFDSDGNVKQVHELDDDTAGAIAGLDVQDLIEDRQVIGYTKKYKIADKNTALANCMKHLGMLTERVEHSYAKMTDDELIAETERTLKLVTGGNLEKRTG